MATVVRRLKPIRITSTKAYRRHNKHKEDLKGRPDRFDQDGLSHFQPREVGNAY